MASAAEREAVLKVEAASLLAREGNGGWAGVTLRHACGTRVRLHVAWDRGGTRFVGVLVDGVLVSLESYPGRG